MVRFGSPSRWLIVKRSGVWTICPPAAERRSGVRGGTFRTGAKALRAFAAGGPSCVDTCGTHHTYSGDCEMRAYPA